MYLQTHMSSMAVYARLRVQTAAGTLLHLVNTLVPAMLLFLVVMVVVASAGAQVAPPVPPGDPLGRQDSSGQAPVNRLESSSATSDTLPEAPSAMVQDRSLRSSTPAVTRIALPATGRVAPVYWKQIPAGWVGQPLTAGDKMELGARSLYSPASMLGYVVTAGYEHAENGQPNYGTDLGAFGQQLGAIALRDTTETAFTDMVFAPLLHQDPRYYVQGSQHGLFHRVVYAITRPILTRTDSGRETVNGSELLGYASASALSYTYYPKINQNFHDTAATFGGSLLGSALGDLVSEFSGQFLEAIHLKKTQ
jgi:hypothetical protein